jgi:F-type H+-transporting ATPase subunit a
LCLWILGLIIFGIIRRVIITFNSAISLELMFMAIRIFNLVGLVPGRVNLMGTIVSVCGLFVWFGLFMSLLVVNYELILSHFVPECPMVLVPLMIVIEVISYFVRPFALVLRIIVNLTCGHLLLVVRGICGIIGNYVPIVLVLGLELIVAVVQSFVFCIILSL